MLSIFQQFVNEYTGPKLTIVVSGGGGSISRLSIVPGSSEILDGISILYSQSSLEDFLGYLPLTPVSGETAFDIVNSLPSGLYLSGHESYSVSIVSRLIDEKYSKLQQIGYICFDRRVFVVRFPTMTEDEFNSKGPKTILHIREWEDMMLSTITLKLLHPSLDFEIPDNIIVEEIEGIE